MSHSPLGRRPAAAAALLFALSLGAGSPGRAVADQPDAPKKRYALLVGCTTYQNAPAITELWGPANDVPRLAALLHDRFDFPKENITQLVGWPDDPAKRASYANIAAGFKNLIARADADTQIVVLFSGHGTLAPIVEPTKEQVGKANKLVFLPLDVKPWEDNQIPGAVSEDELRGWLNQLRDKKANVLIVFDCCHAGSMARGVGEERVRAVKPQDLGMPNTVIEAAAERAKKDVKNMPPPPAGERSRGLEMLPAGLNLAASPKDKGSVTAIYACQPYETAPEMRIPVEAADTPSNYFGLLTWTATEVLTQRQGESQLTYRELQRLLVGKYQEKRGSRGPIPFIDGDMDREVLGLKVWPGRSALVVKHKEDKLFVNAGALMGLTPDSILAVHPPDPRAAKTILGYVQVTKAVDPAEAEVKPCEYPAGKSAVALDKLPDGAVCQVVERSVGDLRVKLAVAKKKDGKEEEARNKRLANISAALDGLRPEVKGLIQVLDSEADAGWVLDVEGDQVLLKQGAGVALSDDAKRKALQEAARERERLGQPQPPRIFGGYGADDVKALTQALEGDLPKIYAWENLWRVAASQAMSAASPGTGLEGDLLRRTPAGQLGDKVVSGALLTPGDLMQIRLTNNTTDNQWIYLVFMNADFSIDVIPRVEPIGQLLDVKTKITSTSFGREGAVVLAFPQKEYPLAPDLDFLKQEPLHEPRSRGIDDRSRAGEGAPRTPFGALMMAGVFGKGTRNVVVDEPSNPTVLSWSWTTIPKP
jgi:Caspase domain